jgi:hypothetical protein
MFDSCAQMGEPFEVLVAVIIMLFALVIGSTILSQVNQTVCINNVEKEMDEFVGFLEETANFKTTTKFSFFPEGICFDQSKHIMSISRHRDPIYCENNCGEPQDTCYVMTFQTPDIPLGFKSKCLNIPTFTRFMDDYDAYFCFPGDSFDDSKYQVIGDGQKIPFGTYTLKNIDDESGANNICIIREK